MRMLALFFLLSSESLAETQQKFPDGFKFGVATASYQVEGAWNENGKGENIWDRTTHTNASFVLDRSNGDVACDSYHKTEVDVQLLKNLRVHFYRFSISWSRILPTGYSNVINPDGVRYYNNLIDTLLSNGIFPLVTIFHWDLPQPLQDIGGWPNGDLADIFLDYAKVLFAKFGDRVKYWITFNEPQTLCDGSYEGDPNRLAPGIKAPGIGTYLCAHTLLRAHAKVYRYYQKVFKPKQKGKIGITLQSPWFEPNSTSAEDLAAADRRIQFELGWFAHPIYSTEGDYPKVMRKRIDLMSQQEHFPRSRLPYFTTNEKAQLRGSADFFGFNHYTSYICTPGSSNQTPSRNADMGTFCWQDKSWESSASSWLKVVPWGFRKALGWIKQQYKNPIVIITENGFSDTGELRDCRRINYYNSYLEELLNAIHKDGSKVIGYTAWSSLDNFEWADGYTKKFGLIHVDFNSPNRTRTPKMMAYTYANIIKTNQIDWNYQPPGFDKCKFN